MLALAYDAVSLLVGSVSEFSAARGAIRAGVRVASALSGAMAGAAARAELRDEYEIPREWRQHLPRS